MPTIDPNLVPTIAPGSLFSRFTSDSSIGIRFFTAEDPVFYETLNRLGGDLALRQLILAKTLDAINLRLGHQALFPWLIQPTLTVGTTTTQAPLSWIWDMHISLPKKWERVRLAKIKRVSGVNGSTGDDFTGVLRLVFTAQQTNSVTEVAIFQADYRIDSNLDWQIFNVDIPISSEESITINPGESETVSGFFIFRTLDPSSETIQAFLNVVTPPIAGTDNNSDGEYDTPAVYEIDDTVTGGASVINDYDISATSHGTGLLVASATNSIPALDSDASTWIAAFNYPFGEAATRASASPAGITIPSGLFKEFNIIGPSSDEPTGDISGNYNPIWINRISRNDASSDVLAIYFATYNLTGSPSTVPVEFASMILERSMVTGQIVAIAQADDLLGASGVAGDTSTDNFLQEFGRGHVVLSNLWDGSSSVVDDFFDAFLPILDEPPDAVFVKEATRLSAFAVSRSSRFTPTAGQAAALRGTREGEFDPDSSNRYVVEFDQGLGTTIDFATNTSLAADKRENPDIERYGYTGSLVHRTVKLVVDASGEDHDYDSDLLPRLRLLFGRDPVFADVWWDGTRAKFYDGDAWVG